MKRIILLNFILAVLIECKSNHSMVCKSPGSFCTNKPEDCDTVYICLPEEDEKFLLVKYPCPKGETCYDGWCSTRPNTFCLYADKDFECVSKVGLYPDPSDCKRFNFCLPGPEEGTKTTAKCEEGYGYNYLTAFCDKPLQNDQCAKENEVVPMCKFFGQNESLKNNPVFFYVCLHYDRHSDLRLYPYIRMCPNGKKFAKNLGCL